MRDGTHTSIAAEDPTTRTQNAHTASRSSSTASRCSRRHKRIVDDNVGMNVQRFNPDSLHRPPGYHHVTIAQTNRLVFLAGQCPVRQDGGVPDENDVDGQVLVAVSNCMTALAAAGATPSHVVRAVVYVVDSDGDTLSRVWSSLLNSELREAFSSASTLVGVAGLGFPGQRVEIDLTAAL